MIDLTYFIEGNNEVKYYELIAISTHIGSSGNFEHYITYCKNINNNKWYKFNDSKVNECKQSSTKLYFKYNITQYNF